MDMENNNMGDFFRKRLKTDSSNEDWGNPGMELDNKVLSQITEPTKPSSKGWGPIILKSGICMLLFLLSSSLIYLNKELSVAKNELKRINKISKNTKPQSTLQNESNEKTIQVKDALIANLKSENEALQFNNQNLKKQNIKLVLHSNNKSTKPVQREVIKVTVESNDKAIKLMKAEKELLASENIRLTQINQQLLNETTTLKSQLKVQRTSIAKIEKSSTVLKDSLNALSSVVEGNRKSLIENNQKDEQFILEKKSETVDHKRFRLGYEYSSEINEFQTLMTFSDHRLVSGATTVSTSVKLFHGLNFSISPKKGWWLKTGLRFEETSLATIQKFGLAYSAANEVSDPSNGTTSNTLNIENLTPFLRSNHTLTFLFDQGFEPEQGSLLQYEAFSNLKLSTWQLPIGVERQFTIGRTNLFIQAGAQLNINSIRDFTLDSSIFDSDQASLNVVSESIEGQDLNNGLNLNIYGEVGIEQGVFRDWYLTAALNYGHTFLNNIDNIVSKDSKKSNALRLGLSHRF